jgi:hypothetical protein
MKEESVKLVAGHESAEGLEPADGALDDPAFSITPQLSSVLGYRPNTAAAIRTNQFDSTVSQPLTTFWLVLGDLSFRIGMLVHLLYHSDHVRRVLYDRQKNYPRGWHYRLLRSIGRRPAKWLERPRIKARLFGTIRLTAFKRLSEMVAPTEAPLV